MRSFVYFLLLLACMGLTLCHPPEKEEPWKIDCSRYTPVTDTVNGVYLIDTVMSDGKLQTDFVRNVTFAGNDTFVIRNNEITDCDFHIRDIYIRNKFWLPVGSKYFRISLDPLTYNLPININFSTYDDENIEFINGNDTIFLFKNYNYSANSGAYRFWHSLIVIRGYRGNRRIIQLYENKNNFLSFIQLI